MGIKSISLTTIALVLSTSVNAAVINTLNGTDYEWLELTATAGMSRNNVEAQLLDINSSLYGYEYASRQLVEDLLLSYASWDGFGGWYSSDPIVTGIESLLNDFGPTYSNTFMTTNILTSYEGTAEEWNREEQISGMYGQESECGETYSCVSTVSLYSNVPLYGLDITPVAAYQDIVEGWDATYQSPPQYNYGINDDFAGSYLVRVSAVPVPAAVWLFGSGLLGLIGFARRKQPV